MSEPHAPLRPLEGVRVADFSSNMAGPFATMILAQLGADVVKVESLEGDDSRAWPPLIDGLSLTHRHMGAGKRGLALDLKNPLALEVAQALIARSDVVLQSMRPGVADRLGIGQTQARAANPEVLYYDLSAFGSGELGQSMPGYDPLVQAYAGIMLMTGHEGMPPARCAPSIIDLGTGQWIALGVMAAMFSRSQGRPVSHMETALIDTAFSVVPYQATHARLTGERPPKSGSGNPIAAPYQCYEARDGMIMIAAPSQRLWEGVAQAMDAPELLRDARFLDVKQRSLNAKALEVEINKRLAIQAVDTWIERFSHAGVPVARVSGLEQAVSSQIAAERGTFMASDQVPLVRLPWLVDGQPVPWVRPAPRLGEHSLEILEELGYDAELRQALVASGAVRAA
jgi:crotonobetainyl-CoA:carnitine CoA-transferase CaiB-like acyl-CoA transferase